jgi:hypothetical protein
MLPSIQRETLNYKHISEKTTQELEQFIEQTLVSKIEEWRGHRVTRWNRLTSRIFKSLAQKFESDTLAGVDISCVTPGSKSSPTVLGYQRELAQIRAIYQINGFCLNLQFTDLGTILERVYGTDVHSNLDPFAEFALGVYCQGYPGRFVSCWIYLASMTRNR